MHVMRYWRRVASSSNRSQLILGILLVVALIPAALLAYLQYRSLSNLRTQTRQAVLDTLKQGLVGTRVKAETDFLDWPRMALLGDDYHDWLEQGDTALLLHLSEVSRRICPHLSLFFAYQLNDKGEQPKVWVFRPSSVVRFMSFSKHDSAEPAIRSLVPKLQMERHFATYYTDIDGERHQVFVHLADYHTTDERTKNLHGKAFGYYGFAIPARTLAVNYFPRLLREHLPRLATLLSADADIAGWVVDETGKVVSSTQPAKQASFAVEEPLGQGVLPGWKLRAGFTGLDLDQIDKSAFLRGVGQSLAIVGLLLFAIISIGVTASRAMSLSRAKSEFVASVSHELKTPLALIHGYVETLHSNRLRTAEEREDYFRIAEAEVLRLSGMIDRILESSKIEAGIKSYSPELTDVTAVVDETVMHFSYELEKGGVTLSRDSTEAHLVAQVDPESLSQAVLNLLSNAVKYSGGDRRIALRVYRKGDDVAVSVSDRGIGIPKEEQAHIFQKFYRVNSTVAAQRSGAGLGLALVKHFAQAHGGSVNVESEPGRGSTFTILLPCVAEKPVNVHV